MQSDQPTSLRQRKKQNTRERIYVETLRLFREKGYWATTIDEIAAAAEVSRATFFNYFPSKEAILSYLGERQAVSVALELQVVLQDPALTPRRKLARMLRVLAHDVEADPDLTRLAVFEIMKVPDALAADPYRRLFRETLRALITEGQQRGVIRASVDPEVAASAILAVYLQQVFDWCVAEQPYSLAQRLEQIVDLLWEGLGA